MTQEKIIEALKEMKLTELNDLVKAIEEEFGISAQPVAVAAAGAEEGAAAGGKVDVTLTNAGGSKINVIKIIREVTGLGLKEAKEIADNGGKVKEQIEASDAEELKAKLEEAGATVEVA